MFNWCFLRKKETINQIDSTVFRSILFEGYEAHWPCNSGADKSLARPGREQATETEDFEFHISYL
jgi:hypothetical protein